MTETLRLEVGTKNKGTMNTALLRRYVPRPLFRHPPQYPGFNHVQFAPAGVRDYAGIPFLPCDVAAQIRLTVTAFFNYTKGTWRILRISLIIRL